MSTLDEANRHLFSRGGSPDLPERAESVAKKCLKGRGVGTIRFEMISDLPEFHGRTETPLVGELEVRWSSAFGDILRVGPAQFLTELSRAMRCPFPRSAASASLGELNFSQFGHGDEEIHFSRSVRVFLSSMEEKVVWELPEFGLFSAGSDDKEAAEGLQEQFAMLIHAFAGESDLTLTPSGAELRRRLESLTRA